jgi:UDP-N-acetylmuramoylalanine--D-glutamate ligase
MSVEHYLVVGLGITGLSVVKFLSKKGYNITVTDSRIHPPHLDELYAIYPNAEVLLGKISVPEYVTNIILSPGIPVTEPALETARHNKIEIIGDIELFAREVDKPVLAITGSNGKSTVTTLLGEMAAASGIKAGVGGNLGTAALDLLNDSNECYILELSSFQLETTFSLHPKAVTILNITPDHMDRYKDLIEYQQAKQRIYSNSEYDIYNRADPLTKPQQKNTEKHITFGLDVPSDNNYGVIQHKGTNWLAKGSQALLAVSEVAMLGDHNIANALAALALGEAAGFPLPAMLQALRDFKGLEHRCEKVAEFNNVIWVNDSKGTNVAATITALEGLAQSIVGKWIIILGGLGKNADFTPLIEPVRRYCKAAILIGSERQNLAGLLNGIVPCYIAKDMPEVISLAQQVARGGDGVLLSPACASLDMFENYSHRGKLFKEHVLQWIDKHDTTVAK